MEHINEVAISEGGKYGVIRHIQDERYVGHLLKDSSVYWESYNPEFTGIKFVNRDKVKYVERNDT